MSIERNAAQHDAARRRFLAHCGKFAIATPPAVTLLLAQSERNYSFAISGGQAHAAFDSGHFETIFGLGSRRPGLRQFTSLNGP